jgi:hypothetical protein
VNKFLTPEQALAQIVRFLKEHKYIQEYSKEIVPAGSVPLGTYTANPDLDIFIVTKGNKRRMFSIIQRAFPSGQVKDGELDIWYVRDLYGYPVDFVIISEDEDKVQTLDHVKYYRKIMTPELSREIVQLKNMMKAMNLYGAELGGITGICCTRLVELYGSSEKALYEIFKSLVDHFEMFVEDPTLEDRNLFASVTKLKKCLMISRIGAYMQDGEVKWLEISDLFEQYNRVYKIIRKRSMTTDKEFSYVNSSVIRAFNELKQRISWWHPLYTYDIMFTPWEIYVGITIHLEEINKSTYEQIPVKSLTQKAINILADRGAKYNRELDCLIYERQPPFKNVYKFFEKALFERLKKKYLDMERV